MTLVEVQSATVSLPPCPNGNFHAVRSSSSVGLSPYCGCAESCTAICAPTERHRSSDLCRLLLSSLVSDDDAWLTADDRCRCYQMSFRFRGTYHVTSPRGLHPRQGPLTASDFVLPSVDHYSSGPQTTLLALPRRLSRGCRRELPPIMAVFTLASHRVAIGENFARQLVLLMEDS